MERKFSFQGKEYDFEPLPRFALKEFSAAPTEKEWAELPAITSFRSRGTDDCAPAADFRVKFALAGGRVFINAVCDSHSEIDFPMKEKYVGWSFDNSLELFFGTADNFYQYLFNADGAKIYYHNRCCKGVPENVNLNGTKDKGKWQIIVSIPSDLIMRDGECAFKVVMTDMNSILGAQFYDSLNNQSGGFGLLSVKCKKSDPLFDKKSLNDADWELYGKMAKSAYVRQNLPVPDLSTNSAIQAALHNVREKLTPVRAAAAQVDFSVPAGKIRPIYGVNFGPKITNQANYDMNEDYRKLGASSMRTHDVPLAEPGSRLVDTIFVFPLEHADPSDPANYYFDQTDFYFENTMAQGPEVYYRLGISIDHAKKRFTAVPVKDFEHYAEICAGIVRHYTKGWANGHHWNIKYWEVWNEPEAKNMWAGTWEEYLEFFVIVYKRLKSEFPEIKVGGFGAMSLNMPLFQQVAKKFAEHGVKPDFLSWHHYSSNMEGMIFQAHAARFMADALNLENAELHLTEWHYVNIAGGTPEGVADMGGVDSAVFTAGVLTGWQDSPMDLSHYYTAGVGGAWAIFDNFHKPKTVYYALCQCGLLQNKYKNRVKTVYGPAGSYAIAGVDDAGNGLAMFGFFKTPDNEVTLQIDGVPADKEIKITVIEEGSTMQEIPSTRNGSLFTVKKNSPSALYLVTFNR
ncbi:MAG: hypothetical protein IKB77_01145 [Lentisphaeria bacterium]|nr:hypothetical protein [Lentisphaeria bacterium]